MNQPDPIYPGLGTCVTKVAGEGAWNLTISDRQGPRLVITPDGELLMPGIKPSETADLLIDMFGRSYGSKLLIAEARALAAETHVKALERKVHDAEARAKTAERHAKRGVVDLLAIEPPPKRHGLLGRFARRQDLLIQEQMEATGKDDDEPG